MRPRPSFRRKLQLSISLLLCLVVTAVAWAAHRRVQGVLVQATRTRLMATGREVAGMLSESGVKVGRDARDNGRNPAFLGAIAEGTPVWRDSAQAVLQRLKARSGVIVYIALVDRRGAALAEVGAPMLPSPLAAAPLSERFGPLAATDSGVLYRLAVAVGRENSDTIGYLISHRRVTAATGAKQVRDLIGAETTLRLGNADGSLWTDMMHVASPPPSVGASATGDELEGEDGTSWFARREPVKGMPWVVAIHTPRDRALAPANDFLLQMVPVSLILVVIGTALAWMLGAQTTAPLADITQAAEAVAAGKYDSRVAVTGTHELASLASSFNTMAERIGVSQKELCRHARDLEAANTELRQSEERYRQLVEAAHEGICTVDEHGVITYANARLADMLGEPVDALVGRSWFSLMPTPEAIEARTTFARRRLGIAESREVELVRADGRAVHAIKAMSSLFDAEGEFTGALFMLSDVTDRRELAAQLAQSQKMEAVGQLAGGIAHDFNNLLTVVTSYSAMLLADLPEDSDARADVQEIGDAAERAASLTRQLLAFSRQQLLQPRLIDLNETVGDIHRMLGRVLREDILLETSLAPSLGSVFADPSQMEQVIVNLAVNARDAMPDGGTLGIATANVELSEEQVRAYPGLAAGPYVLLAVSDSGIGMDEETCAHIFEPFFTTKAPGQGTGLGLSTVYGIVRQSGGHVLVHSEPGQGTTFHIYLPRARAAAKPVERRTSGGTAARGSGTVLLVEDENAVRAVTRKILERSGYTVLAASGGHEALQLFEDRGGEVDVLLTDMVMPEMSGRDLAGRLRERRPSLRVVFMSGYTEDALLRRGGGEGGLFLQKPFTSAALTERLREAFRTAIET